MEPFTSKLNSVLLSLSASNASIARKADIDPSLLRRYRNGERFPRNPQIIHKLCDGLELSDQDRQELEEAYFLSKNTGHSKDVAVPAPDSDSDKAEIINCNADFSLFENNSSKLYPLLTKGDLISALSCINAKERKVYTIFTQQEENTLSDHPAQYILTDICQGEYLIISNITTGRTDQSPNNCSLFPVRFQKIPKMYPCFIYKEECELFHGKTMIVFTENMLIKYTKYKEQTTGFFTKDTNIIDHYRQMFERFKSVSIPLNQEKAK